LVIDDLDWLEMAGVERRVKRGRIRSCQRKGVSLVSLPPQPEDFIFSTMSLAVRTLALIVSCGLVSCTFHTADLKYPTISQADEMDVQWGLPKRKARGGPKQFFQSNSAAAASAGFSRDEVSAPPVTAPANVSPAPAPSPAPAAPQPSVNVPTNLR
jgi:hypothetical protein